MAPTEPQAMILRVVEKHCVRKLKLSSRPVSVEDLISILTEKINLDPNFILLYEDPDFDGKLTSLVDIDELPQKAVVHISFPEQSSSESNSSLVCSETFSDVSSPERSGGWPPDPFPIPTFSFDVELCLREGNANFEKNKKHVKLTRDQKHDILEKLASAIYGYKAYPSDREIARVADSLVTKHPCLKEAGSDTGWNGWKNSIKFKLGNYRTKLRRAGCLEVSVNAGKRSRTNPENEPSHSNIKRPKRAEVNFLPNFPQGHNQVTLETLRCEIAEEVKKTDKNAALISKMMQTTFAFRRQIIVTTSPPVKQFLQLWPALCMEAEVYAEFQRITNQNLPNKFYAQLDHYTPRLMTMFRQKASKTGRVSDALVDILKAHDEQELHDVHTRRTTVLRALPVLLREDVLGFYKTSMDDPNEIDLGDVPVALFITVSGNVDDPVHYHPVRVSIVLESDVVTKFCRLPDAFLVLFGLIYALHLSYPKGLTSTFEFVQKILLGLEDGKLSPKLQTIKNDLMRLYVG